LALLSTSEIGGLFNHMNIRKFAVLVSCLALAGCSTPTSVDTGAVKARTFDFVAPGKADFADDSASTHTLIQAAIEDTLEGKGLSRIDGGGDVKVAYLVLVGNNVSTVAINDYFGYGRDDEALAALAHRASAVENNDPDYYEAGALVIDIIDAGTHKLLRRDHVVRPLFRNTPPDVREARIRDAVAEALDGLKIDGAD
jgi:hypothetical protein